MKTNGPDGEALLSADFAHRVVDRVRKVKQRRRLRRRILTCVAACGVVTLAILMARTRDLISVQAPQTIARQSPDLLSDWTVSSLEFGQARKSGATIVSQPLSFFFPGATAVVDFQYSESTYWHSYDPWWNPNR